MQYKGRAHKQNIIRTYLNVYCRNNAITSPFEPPIPSGTINAPEDIFHPLERDERKKKQRERAEQRTEK